MAEDKKSSSTNLSLILGVGNTAAIIASFVYMYRSMTSMQAQLTRLSDVMSTTIMTVKEMREESSKTKDIDSVIASMDADIREISIDIQQLASNGKNQLLEAQMFAIMDALKESGIEPEMLLQRYPQHQMSGGYSQMHGSQQIPPYMFNPQMMQGGHPQMGGMSQHMPYSNIQDGNSQMSGHPQMRGGHPQMQSGNLTSRSGYSVQHPQSRSQTRHSGSRRDSGGRIGRGDVVRSQDEEEEVPASTEINREEVLRQMSSGSHGARSRR